MSNTTTDNAALIHKIDIAALIYNFALVALATYVVAFHDWSLWTYIGFAFFMVSTKSTD